MRRVLALAACGAVALGAAGCESTQSKSERLEAEAGDGRREKGQKITELDKDIDVRDTVVLSDVNGTAVIATLRNGNKEALARVPLGLSVVNAKGGNVYRNTEPGLDRTLTSAVLLPAGEDQVWVHDQVVALGKPDAAKIKAGVGGEEVRGEVPEIEAPAPVLEEDPTSGLAAVGKVVNKSDTEQKDLVVNVIARDGGKIVAAGRAVVRRLAPGKDADYQAFLIGKPSEGAELEATAPPTTLK